jgi:hypothetical protein
VAAARSNAAVRVGWLDPQCHTPCSRIATEQVLSTWVTNAVAKAAIRAVTARHHSDMPTASVRLALGAEGEVTRADSQAALVTAVVNTDARRD